MLYQLGIQLILENNPATSLSEQKFGGIVLMDADKFPNLRIFQVTYI